MAGTKEPRASELQLGQDIVHAVGLGNAEVNGSGEHLTGNPERAIDNKSRLEDQVFLSGWATPTSRDHKDGAANLENVPVNKLLGREVLLTGWPTPARGALRQQS